MPISVVTHVPVTGDVRENPIATTTSGSAFMNANVDNIQRLCQQNEEKEARSKSWKKDFNKSELMKEAFKVSKLVLRKSGRIEEAIIDMYAHLHLFQEASCYNH
jgi:hypothetical protein